LVEKEIEIMSSLDHPHIVHLNEVFTNADTVFLVMELAKGGEVFDRLLERGAFSEAEAAAIVVQLLCAVGYIHDMGIVHRSVHSKMHCTAWIV
jgi:serine/threonine protein kinase